MTFLLVGTPTTDRTLGRFDSYLQKKGIDHQVLDLVEIGEARHLKIEAASEHLSIVYDQKECQITESTTVYQRAFIPGKMQYNENAVVGRALNDILAFLAFSPALIVNRPAAAASNSCKPFHMYEISQCGFRVPEWHVLGDPESAWRKIAPDENWINKGCSGIRSIAVTVDREIYSQLDTLRFTPALMQKCIRGPNVRVHFVGRKYSAVEIKCSSLDYRYLAEGDKRETGRVSIPEHIELSCLEYMQRQNAQFLGFDFRIDENSNEWFLLEVNPMPGFDFYDRMLEGEISQLLSELLLGHGFSIQPFEFGSHSEIGLIGDDRLPKLSH